MEVITGEGISDRTLIGTFVFLVVIVTASILILRHETKRVVSSDVTTAREYEDRYTSLSLAHATMSARVYELELEHKRLKLEFESDKKGWAKREEEWGKREAEWAAERRYLQASINSLAKRIAISEGAEEFQMISPEQDTLSRGATARAFLMSRFNVSELHLLVSDAQGDWGEITETAKIDANARTVTAALAQETVEWFDRRGRLAQLEQEMRKKRPQQSA